MMKNFWIRTASATIYALLTVFAIYSPEWIGCTFGNIFMKIYFGFVAMVGVFEFYRMCTIKGIQVNKPIGYLLSLLAFLGIAVPVLVVVALPALALLVVISALWRKTENPFAELGVLMLSVVYVVVPLAMIPLIAGYPAKAPALIMVTFIMIWVNDSFAYMGGSLIGKHKLWQRHSPGKTWEGCACGLVGAFLVAQFIAPFLDPNIKQVVWYAMALICSVVGTLGDLAESMFKRSCGVKDSGNIMPGHGGILDRFDSILASMPFIFVIVILI